MRYYSNTAQETTLASSASSGATSIVVSGTTGFPSSVPYILSLDFEQANEELVLVTAVSGTTLTVTRAYDGTAATTHDTGARVLHVHAAKDFLDSRLHEAATTNVHGITGSVVGTSDSQALTNKNLTSGTNTFPATLATVAQLAAHESTTTGVHGVTGNIVGTSDAQTLTGKTIDLTDNTLNGTLSEFSAAVSDADLAGVATAQTLTNKTIDLTDNTVTGTLAEFNTAVSDANLASLAGAEALTNKDLSDSSNTFPWVIQSDTEAIVLTSEAFDFVDVTFATAFASAPKVVSTTDNSNYNTAARLITTTGFRLDIRHIENTAASTTVNVNWIAIL